uniref:Uncharacterized protein n=1 Tax=Tanacetum cinerariifolium TaxID=118510 RepID=A0A6L2JZL6_TANCI|nr:hypothetical protein [Tanacetum cinerariifolium]
MHNKEDLWPLFILYRVPNPPKCTKLNIDGSAAMGESAGGGSEGGWILYFRAKREKFPGSLWHEEGAYAPTVGPYGEGPRIGPAAWNQKTFEPVDDN